jgi:hypothetical protein
MHGHMCLVEVPVRTVLLCESCSIQAMRWTICCAQCMVDHLCTPASGKHMVKGSSLLPLPEGRHLLHCYWAGIMSVIAVHCNRLPKSAQQLTWLAFSLMHTLCSHVEGGKLCTASGCRKT